MEVTENVHHEQSRSLCIQECLHIRMTTQKKFHPRLSVRSTLNPYRTACGRYRFKLRDVRLTQGTIIDKHGDPVTFCKQTEFTRCYRRREHHRFQVMRRCKSNQRPIRLPTALRAENRIRLSVNQGSNTFMQLNGFDRVASPHFSPGSRMLAQGSCVRTPRWRESGSRSYHLSEAQVRARENQPGPG